MLIEALKSFEGTMLFVSHDRAFLRALGTRVLEVGGESGTEREPLLYPGTYVEYVERTGHEARSSDLMRRARLMRFAWI
jgi:ATPase subunit of ABC transporter with duplicated ATPase domains